MGRYSEGEMMLHIKYRPEMLKAALFRLFGVLHLLLSGAGFYYIVVAVRALMRHGRLFEVDPEIPYYSEAFLFRTTVNVILLVIEVIAALYLLRLSRTGLRLNNVFCLSFLVYESFGMSFGFGEGVSMSLGASAGTGGMGTALQLVTGYPVIAYVALNLAGRVGKPTSQLTGPRRYPAGIVLISLWAFFLAVLLILGAAIVGRYDTLGEPFVWVQALMFSFGTLLVLAGFGVLRRQEWARFTMVALAAFLTWQGSSTAGWSSWKVPLVSAVFFLTIHSWMMWYLLRRWDAEVFPAQARDSNATASSGGGGE